MKSIALGFALLWVMLFMYILLAHNNGAMKDEEFRILAVTTCCLELTIVFGWFDISFKDRSDD